MALIDFWITQGDAGPALTGTLTDRLGAPVDLTSKAIECRIWKSGAEEAAVSATGVPVNAVQGGLTVDLSGKTADLAGLYRCAFIVSELDLSNPMTYPNDGSFRAKANTKPPPAPV